jgi:hypothetical protein
VACNEKADVCRDGKARKSALQIESHLEAAREIRKEEGNEDRRDADAKRCG